MNSTKDTSSLTSLSPCPSPSKTPQTLDIHLYCRWPHSPRGQPKSRSSRAVRMVQCVVTHRGSLPAASTTQACNIAFLNGKRLWSEASSSRKSRKRLNSLNTTCSERWECVWGGGGALARRRIFNDVLMWWWWWWWWRWCWHYFQQQ